LAPAISARSLPAPTPAPAPAHVPALDGIRGLAFLLVLVNHLYLFMHAVGMLGGENPWTTSIFTAGRLGVDVFFTLSGFLITGILLRSKETDTHYFRNFYMRRVLRIFPVYYAFLATCFILQRAVNFGPPVSASAKAMAWTYTLNFYTASQGFFAISPMIGHSWSLAIEEQFYLIWPLLVYLLSRRTLARVCAITAVASAFVRVLFFVWHGSWFWMFCSTPARLDGLALGALMAVIAQDATWSRTLGSRWHWFTIPVFVMSATLPAWSGTRSSWLEVLSFALATLFACALIGRTCLATGKPAPRWLESSPLRFVGRYSYALYLVHEPIIVWLAGMNPFRALGQHHPAAMVAANAVTMVVAILGTALLSWHLIEKRFLRLKRYFA
jgi:peptidoglycan/LPS O-acetylase OafA/YrhL